MDQTLAHGPCLGTRTSEMGDILLVWGGRGAKRQRGGRGEDGRALDTRGAGLRNAGSWQELKSGRGQRLELGGPPKATYAKEQQTPFWGQREPSGTL